MLKRFINNLLHVEEGATAVEYAIMASAIAAVIAAIVFSLGLKVSTLFNSCAPPWT